ncbi:MAG: AAA-like domain-containing protein [Pleurocapsa sp. MO_226.B13]|nr:AAA-like domain-containing protein [Pleurocapsa sp. MO_226.B13]
MKFNLDEALNTANQVIYQKQNRHLTDVEIIVFKGAWEREDYDTIAAKNQYATSYISQDIAPKLWKNLSEALGEKVKKSNFKESLKRLWESGLNSGESLTAGKKADRVDSLERSARSPVLKSQHSQLTGLTNEIYIERPPIESICYETLLHPGSLVRIKAPSLMGKTSLITRILSQITQEGYHTVNLSLELADRSTHLTNLNKFLRWFCLNITKELGFPNQLDEYWDEEGIGAKVSCTTYFEEYLLSEVNSPFVLCLDDVDLLFPYPEIYEDFFGLLRSWYEKARSRKLWQKLRLVIAHSTNVYIRLNINQSPFNVGLPIELPEFTIEQVQELAKLYELEVNQELENLMSMVGGHPYLLEQAFSYLNNNRNVSLAAILKQAPTDAGIYSNHLREHWLNLQQNPEIALAFKQVVTSDRPLQIEPISTYQLLSMGLVKLLGNQVEPRCNLYRQYFSDRAESL